jgi:pimeloyl-ACP methyl ester carboxylesterase
MSVEGELVRIDDTSLFVVERGRALELDRYAVLGHSYGAFVALQNALDYPGMDHVMGSRVSQGGRGVS